MCACVCLSASRCFRIFIYHSDIARALDEKECCSKRNRSAGREAMLLCDRTESVSTTTLSCVCVWEGGRLKQTQRTSCCCERMCANVAAMAHTPNEDGKINASVFLQPSV